MDAITRRRFLQTTGALAGGACVLGGLPARTLAQHPHAGVFTPPRRYIFCYFEGGWDLLLGLDPRSPRSFPRSLVPETLIEPAYEDVANLTADNVIETPSGIVFGPAIGALADHADKLAVVRGISMETLEHDTARSRFLTGVSAEQLTQGVDAHHRHVTDRLVAQQAFPPTDVTGGPPRKPEPGAHGKISRTLTDADLFSLVGLDATAGREHRLKDVFGVEASSRGPRAAAARAAEAIMSGLSSAVLVTVQRDLDHHDRAWSEQHGKALSDGFGVVATLIRFLERERFLGTDQTWLDHTIILGFSEFGRSALRNRRGGRDHALTNSCFLAGGPVVGGQVFGRSSDVGMLPVPVDLATGLPEPDGEILRPEHVLQTLFMDAGHGPDEHLHAAPLGALLRAV